MPPTPTAARPLPSRSRDGNEFKLDAITTKPRRLANRMVLYAHGGWGKTSFAAEIPNAVFLMVGDETGLLTLIDSGQVSPKIPHFPHPACTKFEIENAIMQLAIEDHPYKCLVIDSITCIQKIYDDKVCDEKFRGDWGETGFNSFDKGPKAAAAEWDSTIRCLDYLKEKNISVLLLGHADVVKHKNPEGPDYDRWVCDVGKHSWKRIYNSGDMVLFGNFETNVDKVNRNKTAAETKGKASGGQQRLLMTTHHAAYDAKNRHGLPDEIDCGSSPKEAWAAFKAALAQGAANKN